MYLNKIVKPIKPLFYLLSYYSYIYKF